MANSKNTHRQKEISRLLRERKSKAQPLQKKSCLSLKKAVGGNVH